MELSREHREILDHTLHRAAGERYCGGSTAMNELVASGLMRSLGRASWCPDEYFTITNAGRQALREYDDRRHSMHNGMAGDSAPYV